MTGAESCADLGMQSLVQELGEEEDGHKKETPACLGGRPHWSSPIIKPSFSGNFMSFHHMQSFEASGFQAVFFVTSKIMQILRSNVIFLIQLLK